MKLFLIITTSLFVQLGWGQSNFHSKIHCFEQWSNNKIIEIDTSEYLILGDKYSWGNGERILTAIDSIGQVKWEKYIYSNYTQSGSAIYKTSWGQVITGGISSNTQLDAAISVNFFDSTYNLEHTERIIHNTNGGIGWDNYKFLECSDSSFFFVGNRAITKLDSAGNLLLYKELNNFGLIYEIISAQSFNENKDLMLVGFCRDRLNTGSNADISVIYLDDSANVVWSKAYGSQVNDIAYSSVKTSDNNVVISAKTDSIQSRNILLCIDSLGNVQWTKSTSDIAHSYAHLTPSNLGFYSLYTDVQTDQSVYSKYDLNGNIEMRYSLFDSLSESKSITIAPSSNNGFISINQSLIPQEDTVNVIFNTNEMGIPLCKTILLSDDTIQANLSLVSSFNNIGTYNQGAGSNTIYPTVTTNQIWSQNDCYTGCTSNYSIDNQQACDSYTWIDGVTYTSSDSTATHLLTNASGCDSIVSLNLIITIIDTNVSIQGETLSANMSGASYQWLNCDSSYSEVLGEVNQTYSPTTDGSYAVEINNNNNCIDTSSCYFVSVVGIIQSNFKNSILAYPNPTIGDFTIDMGATFSEINLSFIDINNKLLKESNFKNTQLIKLYLNEPPGVYFIVVNSNNNQATIRLIKE